MALITVDDIKNHIASQNIDPELFINQFELAERKYIKKQLGATLYNSIVSQNDSRIYQTGYETLINGFLKPALCCYVVYESLPGMRAQITANGLLSPTPLQNEPASDRGAQTVQQKYLSDAEMYMQEAKDYMCDNNISYAGDDVTNKTLPFIY